MFVKRTSQHTPSVHERKSPKRNKRDLARPRCVSCVYTYTYLYESATRTKYSTHVAPAHLTRTMTMFVIRSMR